MRMNQQKCVRRFVIVPAVGRRRNPTQQRFRAIAIFNVGWDQLSSSTGPPSENVEKSWWVGEAPLVPPRRFCRPNKPTALTKIVAP